VRLRNKDSGKIRILLEKTYVPTFLDINNGFYMAYDKRQDADNALVIRHYSVGFGDPVCVSQSTLESYEQKLETALKAVKEVKRMIQEKEIGMQRGME
jgi:hypothetical protein